MSKETELTGGQSIQEQYAEMGRLKAQSKKMSTKIKTHLKKHKEAYIVGGVGLTVGVGVGYFLHNRLGVEVDNSSFLANQALVNFKPTNIQQNTYVTQLVRRGHAGTVIRCLETGEEFASQNRAAELLGISASALSKHLNGNTPHVKGMHFEAVDSFNKDAS